jgi:lipopolysaccharide export system permease protein
LYRPVRAGMLEAAFPRGKPLGTQMKILTRYLLRAHLGPFLFAFCALTGVVLINTLAKRLAELAGKGLPLAMVLEFFVLALPATVALTFPMAVLVSVLYTFSTMVGENEITALKASGVDLRRLLAPVLLASAIIAGTMIWFNDRVLPEANHRWSQLYVDIARKTPTLYLQPQVLNRISPATMSGQTYFLRTARLDPATNRMWDVTIYDVSHSNQVRTIYADSGRAMFNAARTDLLLQLYDGHTRELELSQPGTFRRVFFDQQVFGIPGVGTELAQSAGGGYRGTREMTISMLQANHDTVAAQRRRELDAAASMARDDLAAALGDSPTPPEGMPGVPLVDGLGGEPPAVAAAVRTRRTAEGLESAQRRVRDLEAQMRNLQVEIHKKYSIAIASLVFVIVGAPLALRFGGAGIGMVIATSLLIFSVYYIGLIGGESLAGRGLVSPIFAMWCVNVLMTVLGVVGFTVMGRETSTARSGALAGITQSVRDLAASLRGRRRGRHA